MGIFLKEMSLVQRRELFGESKLSLFTQATPATLQQQRAYPPQHVSEQSLGPMPSDNSSQWCRAFLTSRFFDKSALVG